MAKRPWGRGEEVMPEPSTEQQQPVKSNGYKTVRKLTRDITTIAHLGEAYVECQSELYQMNLPDPADPSQTRAVSVIDCLDCDRGLEYTLVCGTVIVSSLQQVDPPLKGRIFHLKNLDIMPGKRYRKTLVEEVERS